MNKHEFCPDEDNRCQHGEDEACPKLTDHAVAQRPEVEAVMVPRATLRHWVEYWNGNRNHNAMHDALEHIIDEIENVLNEPANAAAPQAGQRNAPAPSQEGHAAGPASAAAPAWIALFGDEVIRARKKFPLWQQGAVVPAAVVCEEAGELIRAALQCDYEDSNIEACDKEAI